ncbi:MAG: hypothetical protein WCX46_02335, partial [Candidatus Paceibacterota bacterium]
LKSTSRITTQSTNKFTVITILNWDLYQSNNQVSKQPVTSQYTTNIQQITTYKNNKKIEKKEKNINTPKIDPTSSFDEFWNLYPKKEAKTVAKDKWDKLNQETKEIIMKDLPKRIKCDKWTQDGGIYVPMASTYINQERWNDEIRTHVSTNTLKPPEGKYDNFKSTVVSQKK